MKQILSILSKKAMLLLLLLSIPFLGMAMQETGDGLSVESILTAITPLIVLGVTQLSKWLLPKLPGIVVLMMAAVWSSIVALVYDLLDGTDLSWLQQFIYGLLAIVVDQIDDQIKIAKGRKKVVKQ